LRIVAIALAFPYFIGALLYALFPGWITFLSITLPDWFRLIMVGVSTPAILFTMWGLRTLGKNWAPSMSGVRNDTVLVTDGPYGIVRNPIYLGALIFIPSLALVAASWLLLLPGLALSAMLYTYVADEEVTLIDRFGDAYVEYMKRTPRLIPKLKHKHSTHGSESHALSTER
jgi:protein-S-isoprenylcysteine O-methyltransferase Ste14